MSAQPAGTSILTVDTDPPMVLTHVPMDGVPSGWVNLYGHVHNNEPLRVVALGKRLLVGEVPGETTVERIRRVGSTRWLLFMAGAAA